MSPAFTFTSAEDNQLDLELTAEHVEHSFNDTPDTRVIKERGREIYHTLNHPLNACNALLMM